MSLLQFFAGHGPEVGALVLEHLYLTGVSVAIAVAIGIPTGVLLTRVPWLVKPVMGLANISQTIPSLALFGFLIPLNVVLFNTRVLGGIGAGTAIAALVLYALLPIIRGTYTGITGVDGTVREAGRAMGMTDAQILLKLELPLALEPILAGVRVATVLTVGVATIAAAIDAGGLGKYIFRGLRMNDETLILAGALPAAAIAIVADWVLGAVEKLFKPGAAGSRHPKAALASLAAVFLIGLWATMPKAAATSEAGLVVGAKAFTEQLILGELIAQTAESQAGLKVTRRFDLGGNLAHQALVSGEIDAYVEYTGTALTAILHQAPVQDPEAVYRRVRDDYQSRYHLAVTEPLGFNNTFAILVRGKDAQQHGIKTISDVTRFTPRWQAGFGQDFMSRPDGFPGFSKAYGLRFAGQPREMDLALTYRALKEGQVDLIAGNSTDGLITRYGLVQLEDDRRYFPPYDAVPVVREDTLARAPKLREVLKRLGGVVTVEEMRTMNYQVDGDRKEPAEVVREFLKRKGLL